MILADDEQVRIRVACIMELKYGSAAPRLLTNSQVIDAASFGNEATKLLATLVCKQRGIQVVES